MLKVTLTNNETETIVALEGRMDTAAAPEFEQALAPRLGDGTASNNAGLPEVGIHQQFRFEDIPETKEIHRQQGRTGSTKRITAHSKGSLRYDGLLQDVPNKVNPDSGAKRTGSPALSSRFGSVEIQWGTATTPVSDYHKITEFPARKKGFPFASVFQ